MRRFLWLRAHARATAPPSALVAYVYLGKCKAFFCGKGFKVWRQQLGGFFTAPQAQRPRAQREVIHRTVKAQLALALHQQQTPGAAGNLHSRSSNVLTRGGLAARGNVAARRKGKNLICQGQGDALRQLGHGHLAQQGFVGAFQPGQKERQA